MQSYLIFPKWIEEVDKKYGNGASKFIGEALNNHLGDNQPELIILYKKLTSDLNKNPSSKEIQEIVEEIANSTKKDNEALKIEDGENYWGYTAEQYLSNSIYITAIDKKYGNGASKFIGEALKFYCENIK